MADDLDRISESLAVLLRISESERLHAIRQEATGVRLSHTELRFLAAVAEHGPVPGTPLGARLHLSQPTASRTLRRLEHEGLVRRSADGDGRAVAYRITAAGSRLLTTFEQYRREQLATALRGMTPARRRDLAELLEQFVAGATTPPAGDSRRYSSKVSSSRAAQRSSATATE